MTSSVVTSSGAAEATAAGAVETDVGQRLTVGLNTELLVRKKLQHTNSACLTHGVIDISSPMQFENEQATDTSRQTERRAHRLAEHLGQSQHDLAEVVLERLVVDELVDADQLRVQVERRVTDVDKLPANSDANNDVTNSAVRQTCGHAQLRVALI